MITKEIVKGKNRRKFEEKIQKIGENRRNRNVYFLEVGFQDEYPIISRKCP